MTVGKPISETDSPQLQCHIPHIESSNGISSSHPSFMASHPPPVDPTPVAGIAPTEAEVTIEAPPSDDPPCDDISFNPASRVGDTGVRCGVVIPFVPPIAAFIRLLVSLSDTAEMAHPAHPSPFDDADCGGGVGILPGRRGAAATGGGAPVSGYVDVCVNNA